MVPTRAKTSGTSRGAGTKAGRTRTPSADMRTALLDAAIDLLETEGPDALSVRRIAAAAGVAPMGVYNHFDSKFGIVDALFVQGFERLRDALTSIAPTADTLEDLREAGRRYRGLAVTHPMIYRVMFLRAIPGFEPSDEAAAVAASALESLATLAQRAMDAGALARCEPLEAAQIIWASVHGAVALELLGIGPGDPADASSTFGDVCSTVLRGLAP